MSRLDHCIRSKRIRERPAVETITIIVARQQIKLSLTLSLRMLMGKGRLRAVNKLGEINQFV